MTFWFDKCPFGSFEIEAGKFHAAIDEDDGLTLDFEIDGKEPQADEEEEEDENETDDWTNKYVWRNYGAPNLNTEGSIKVDEKLNFSKFPFEVNVPDDDEEEIVSVYCVEHQPAQSNVITFKERNDFMFAIQWKGKVFFDEKEMHPFEINCDITFEHLTIMADDRKSADKLLAKHIADPEDFQCKEQKEGIFVYELASKKQGPAKKQKM